jgi:hypothetical protein
LINSRAPALISPDRQFRTRQDVGQLDRPVGIGLDVFDRLTEPIVKRGGQQGAFDQFDAALASATKTA